MKVVIWIEGQGGRDKSRGPGARRAFGHLLEAAGLQRSVDVRMGGSRGDTRRAFERSLGDPETVMLLLDSEAPVGSQHSGRPWNHLQRSDRWQKPAGTTDEQCHLMVQCMESWFLADPEAVASYFGQGFDSNALPKNPRVERVPKQEVLRSLDRAARPTKKKGYRKGAHAFSLLATIDPKKIENASPWAKRFFERLRAVADG